MTVQSERWPEVSGAIKPLLQKHWEEIALDREAIPLDPDYERYALLDAAGILHFTTVREDGRLVGYYASTVAPHPHYKSTLFAFLDVYFILPEFRGARTALLLFTAMEKAMRKLGVRKLVSMTKLDHDVSPLFEKLGWRAVETAYTKLLE